MYFSIEYQVDWGPTLALGSLFLIALLLIGWCKARNRFTERRGKIPIEVEAVSPDGNRDTSLAKSTEVEFSRYLLEDSPEGHITQPPGASGISTSARSASTPPDTFEGFLARWMHFASQSKSGHGIKISVDRGCKSYALAVRVTHNPHNKVEAAQTFEADDLQKAISDAGCFCLQAIRRCPTNFRHTPRWENWSGNQEGYRKYREALAAASAGDNQQAILQLKRAMKLEPNNTNLRLVQGQLQEGMGEYEQAFKLYQKCAEIWADIIEVRYRLVASRINAQGEHGTLNGWKEEIEELEKSLRVRRIVVKWALTWKPGRKQLGERRYWSSWLKAEGPGKKTWLALRRSKRKTFLNAAKVMYQSLMLIDSEKDRDTATQNVDEIVKWEDDTWINRFRTPGWMAAYNAACHYSLAMQFSPNDREELAGKALRQLAYMVRIPTGAPDPDWIDVDPNLKHLKESKDGMEWLRDYLGRPSGPTLIKPPLAG